MLVSVDTETTGLDVYHSARPFFVTTCTPKGEVQFWQWDVDPLTRKVMPLPGDLAEIQQILMTSTAEEIPGKYWKLAKEVGLDRKTPLGIFLDRLEELERPEVEGVRKSLQPTLVLQNSKFDVAMLRALFGDRRREFAWDWGRTHDTLVMGHILASNKPHDLTSMAVQYLGKDIQPLEDALEEATKKARSHCQHRLPEWRIAKAGLEEMPSARDKTWKYDAWLPLALARELNHPNDHPWYYVLQEYANADSAITVALFGVMYAEIRRRGLEEIYLTRLKAMELAHRMEWRGLTGNTDRTDVIETKYKDESMCAGQRCLEIAATYGYELNLPKSGNNNSLKWFCFGEPVDGRSLNPVKGRGIARRWLDLPVVGRTDGGEPSMDKKAMEEYEATLPSGSVQREFLANLSAKRKRDTAVQYIQGYRRFWLPYHERVGSIGATGFPWYVLHPSLNPCGTDTLRWSSSNPNEQNISKQGMRCLYCFGDGEGDGEDGKCRACKGKGVDSRNLRFCFGPPPGWEWWSLDAKNIELRLPYFSAGEKELIDLFERPDDPPYYGSTHLLNFHTVFPDIWEREIGTVCDLGCCKGKIVDHTLIGPHCKKKFASTYYQDTKNGGFSKQYGSQRPKTDATFKRKGAHDLLDSRFSKLTSYNKKQVDFANKHGYVETLPDRTVNPTKGYPLLCTRTENGSILPTVPLSYHVQGSAMWWTFKAMIRVQEQLDKWNKRDGFDGYIAMQVHDELVLALPKRGDPSKWDPKSKTPENKKVFLSTNLWRIWVIKELMAKGGDDFGIPTPVGVEYHPVSWDTGVTFA